MMNELNQFYLTQREPFKSCLLGLRDIILAVDKDITPKWEFNLPFFYYKEKMLCYIWIHKHYKCPYIAFANGDMLDDKELLEKKRINMKLLLVNEYSNLPEKKIKKLLRKLLYIRRP
jgi:hypothetical protein